MTTYRVEVQADAREVYIVEADSPEEAAANVYDGEHYLTEVSVGDVVSVEEDK